jgi:hypothetical protein
MTSIGMIVTQCLTAKTLCHHNFGYGSRKRLIPRAERPSTIGPLFAVESKLVYSR